MFDEKLEKFFKQEKWKDMNRSQMTTKIKVPIEY
jgi:hypothetical protein